jgi:Uma2 family endonuclease
MRTLQEIRDAIRHLSFAERKSLWEWFHELVGGGDFVAESAPAYGAAREAGYVTVEEYLELDDSGDVRYEYVAGEVFAMSGPSLRHTRIVGNVFNAFSEHLRGKPCEAFVAHARVHIRHQRNQFYYYPDVVVACDVEEQAQEKRDLEGSRLVVEVLSPSTARIDRGEKAWSYRQIPTLEEYVLIAQRGPEVTIFRRSENWQPIVINSLDAAAELRSIGLSLPLARIYERVMWANETR